MSDVVGAARAAGRGVGAFNVIGIEHAEAIVAGAQAAASPVVLQISENCVAYHGALEPIARACLSIADSAGVPVVVHLDHATREDLVRAAAGLGLRSVMYDASALPYEQNVRPRPRWPGGARTGASGWRPSWVRSAGRTACMRRAPGPSRTRRPPMSRRPAWTRWRSRSAARTRC